MRSKSGRARGILATSLVLSVFVPLAGSAQQTPPGGREHVVKAGDTLWELARVYLNNPFLWPLIYEANRLVVQNPHRIFPAERLIIPLLPGETPPPAPVPNVPAQEMNLEGRTRFYHPVDTSSTPLLLLGADAVRVSRVEPREYYATPWLAEPSSLAMRGQVFKPGDPRTERDKLETTFHPFDRVYLTYVGTERPQVGDLLLVVSIGRGVKPFGRIIEPTGVIRVDSLKPSTMVGMVTHQFGPLQTGDFVIPMDSFPAVYDRPVDVENGTEGELIDFLQPQPLNGVTDQAFLSIGSIVGLKVGDEVVAMLPRRRPDVNRDEQLPERPIARLIVVRVTPNTSTARITHLDEAALRAGLRVRVVRRMP